jgi:hypothetical protein
LGFTAFSQFPPSVCVFSDFCSVEIGRGDFEGTRWEEEVYAVDGRVCCYGKTGEGFLEEFFDALGFCLEERAGLCVAFDRLGVGSWVWLGVLV